MSLVSAIQSVGGIASVRQLELRGYSAYYVRGAFRRYGIIRVRRGWYATDDVDERLVRAARVGGSLTCVSACAYYGGWLPPSARLHVAVPGGSRHLKHPRTGSPIIGTDADVVVHWNGAAGPDSSFTPGVLPAREAFVEVLRCQSTEFAFAVAESLMANRILGAEDLAWLALAAPIALPLLKLVRCDAGAGSESLFRFRMALLGIRMRSQVDIPGVGRVDFLIGDRLIIEIDSREHHSGAENRLRDLDRDSVAFALGYLPLRFDYSQIMTDWDAVASTVCAIIERREHLAR